MVISVMILDTDFMDATERFEAIIYRSELPDRIPIHMMGIPEYSTTMIEFIEREDEIMEDDPFFQEERNMMFTPLGDKTLAYFFGAEDTIYSAGYSKTLEFILDKDGKIIDDVQKAAEFKAKTEGEYVNYMGRRNGWQELENGHRYTWYVDGYLKTKKKIEIWFDKHKWPHELPVQAVNRKAVADFQSNWSDRMYLNGGISHSGLFEQTWFMMGFDSFAKMSFKERDFLHKIIDSVLLADLNGIEALKPLHLSTVYISDDLGQKGRPLISPRIFKKYFYEPYSEAFAAIHDIGAKAFLHSCGNIVELLPMLVDAGLDGWQSMEIPAEIDHKLVKQKFGDDLILIGGIDSSRELTFGNKQSIEAHVKEQFEKMGKDGGYIAGPAHDYLKVPLENAIAMRDAIYKLGKY